MSKGRKRLTGPAASGLGLLVAALLASRDPEATFWLGLALALYVLGTAAKGACARPP